MELQASTQDLLEENRQLRRKNAELLTRLAEHQTEQDQLNNVLPEKTTLQRILEQHSPVVITDSHGTMTYVNAAFCELCQYTRDELIGQNANFVSAQYHPHSFWEQLWQTISTGQIWQGTIRNRAKDGSEFWIEMVVTPVLNEQGKIEQFVALRQDATRYQQAQEQLHFQSQILAHIHDAVVGVDTEYLITYWNQGAQRLYGKKVSEAMHQPLSSLYQVEWLSEQDQQGALQSLAEKKFYTVEMIHRLANGEALFVEETTQLLTGEQGEKTGYLSVIRNITERVEANKVLQQTLAELTKRNHELDNYVYKVSHDLRSPLSSVLGLINLNELETDTMLKAQYVDLIKSRIEKLDHFIQSVLSHSQLLHVEITTQRIYLQQLIQDEFNQLTYHPNWPRIQLTIQSKGELPFFSDPLRLKIIVKNLLSNAIKFLNVFSEESFIHCTIDTNEQECQLLFGDNGIGIDKNYVSRIFTMFFRASTTSEGSGLGLYLVKQTVEMLQGTIGVESKKGTGTLFRITLPNVFPQNPPRQMPAEYRRL